MPETHARVRWKHDDQVDESIVTFPLVTGDEAFRFLEEFEKACGGPIKDAARDRRWVDIQREKATAAKAA